MSWKNNLREASFRGVPFYVQSTDDAGGRRVDLHQYPNRDQPTSQDLGREAEVYALDVYLVGDDYMQQRDRLLAACRKRGPGILVHPYVGDLYVRLQRWRKREASAEGRMCRMLLTFVEEGRRVEPTAATDYDAALDDAAAAMTTQATEQFDDGISLEGVPEFAREAASEETTRVGELIEKLGTFSDLAQDVAEQSTRVERLIQDASELATSPLDLRDAVVGAVTGIRGALTNALGAMYAYETLFGIERTSSPETSGESAYGELAAGNADAIVHLTRQVAVGEAARAATSVSWPTHEEAVAARDRLIAEIDALAGIAPDDSFTSLQTLRTAVVDAIPKADESLPRLGTLVLQETAPSLVAVYDLYGSVDREADLIARNGIRHPGFVPALTDLEVVIDG